MGRTRPKRCEAVLIVEDEPLIAMDIEWMLTREGWAVLGPFRSVGEVLHLLKDTRPDAALLDYNVCGEAITPVAERLRALDVPMVVSSADFPLNAPLSEVCEALRDAKSIGKPIDERRLFDALNPDRE